ncbi:MAG TPA: polysaccharide biosynthesis/export family protein [Pyrinomonadaceae bacterium]|nr:polysaccharide biosynthesis/export family protein [Pyrinomonadaceae bacterium]
MRNKLLILFAVFAALGVTALAQTQSGGGDFQPSSVDNQGIRRYRMGAGDILDVRVFGQPDLTSAVEVDEDGNISSLPFIEDPIPAKCKNEKEVQKLITEAYAKYIVKPRVSVRITERRSRPPAIVFGAVRLPSRVSMNRRLRLHEVLVTAGGVTQNASGTIDILHTENEMCVEPEEVPTTVAAASAVAANHSKESDIGKLESFKIIDLKGGSAANNPYIRPGDIVIVNEGDPVFITGAVFQPREMIIKDQITLSRAIAMAGGPQKLANTSQVHIYRKKDGKIGSEDLKFDYDAIRKGKAPDVLLQAYDIVDVRPVGTFSPKSLGEMLKGMSMGTLGSLPMRIPF